MYMHPTESIMNTFTVADFMWKDGYLTSQREDFTVKISSTKVIFNFASFDRLRSTPSYAKLTAKFISDIADECFLNNSEIFITHFINKTRAYVEVEHADFGHTNFDIFMKVFNGNPMIYPQVDLLMRVRLSNVPTDFQYLMDICEQHCELFPIRDECLGRIEQIMMNKKYRDSSWPIAVHLNEIKEFIDKYAVFPNCDEIVIDKRTRDKAIAYTRNRYRNSTSLKHFNETTEAKFEPQALAKIILQRLINDQVRMNEEVETLKSKINKMTGVLTACVLDSEDYELYDNSMQKSVHFQDEMLRYNIFNPIGLGKAGLGKYPRKRVPRQNESPEPSPSHKINDSQATVNNTSEEVSSVSGKDVVADDSPSIEDPWRASDLQYRSPLNDDGSNHSRSNSSYDKE